MKRVASYLSLLVSSLLLTSCDLPKSLDEFVGWRDKFSLELSPEQIQFYLGAILAIAVSITVLKGLFGVLRKGQRLAYFTWALVQFLSVALIYIFAEVANTITANTLPAHFTLDSTLASLRVGLTLDPVKAILGVWTFSILTTIPIAVSLAIFVEVLITVVILLHSSIWTKSKSIWTIIAAWIGHWLFLIILIISIAILDEIYPNWDFIGVSNVVNFVFLFIMGIFGFLCYITIPSAGFLYGPHIGPVKNSPTTPATEEAKNKSHPGLDDAVPIIFAPSNRQPPPQSPPTDDKGRPEDNADWVEGEYREVPVYRLGRGPAKDSGKKPPEEGSGNNDDTTPPSPKSPSGNGGNTVDPDWVPPESSAPRSRRGKPITEPDTPDQSPSDSPSPEMPKSQRIRKARRTINDAAILTEVGISVLGRPEISATIDVVRRTSNAALAAAEGQQKLKEDIQANSDWVPPST